MDVALRANVPQRRRTRPLPWDLLAGKVTDCGPVVVNGRGGRIVSELTKAAPALRRTPWPTVVDHGRGRAP